MSDERIVIEDVADTSFWVAHYRAVESERPNAMFEDPFAAKLVGDRGRKIAEAMEQIGRYTEWSVVSRTVMIDEFITRLLDEGVDTVVNLGAGLDSRPYWMDLPAELNWIEVDKAQVIAHKSAVLANEAPKCRLSRVVVDLADEVQRRSFLTTVAPEARKVLILTEGVIPYLSPEQVTELGRDLRARSNFAFWITEYFSPEVYRYLKASLRTQKMRNAPFRFYPDDWFGFFSALGWKKKAITYSGEIAKRFGRRPPMPWFARLLMPILPAALKERAARSSGYVVFERE